MNKENIKARLQILLERYNQTTRLEAKENVSEETIRTWLNEFLGLFGWDVKNTHEVIQERCLRGVAGERLREIQSPHRKPDYILINGTNIKSFLDAKAPTVDIINDPQVAYQIRSYGWSAQVPCAFVSNFDTFVIFDKLTKEYYTLCHQGSQPFEVMTPKCVVIIGKISTMDSGQIAAFENFRNSLNNILVITFDELYQRIIDLITILSENTEQEIEPSSQNGNEEYPF